MTQRKMDRTDMGGSFVHGLNLGRYTTGRLTRNLEPQGTKAEARKRIGRLINSILNTTQEQAPETTERIDAYLTEILLNIHVLDDGDEA